MSGARRLACARIAWRQAKRAPWRSVLAVTMVAIPIAALVSASTVISTAMTTNEERATAAFGTAELRIEGAVRLDELRAALPPDTLIAQRVFARGISVFNAHEAITVQVEELPRIDRAPVIGMVQLSTGRPAIEPGDAVVHPEVLRIAGARVGERIRLGALHARVTGTGVLPLSISQPFAVLAPGTLREEGEHVAHLVDLPDPADLAAAAAAARRTTDADVMTRRDFTGDITDAQQRAIATATSFAVTALALGATGLIAAAAFAVGARRQLRTLGLVAAIGGESRDVRAVVLFGGTVLGGVGAMLGSGLGLAGAWAALPYVDRYTDAVPGPLEVNWPAVVGAPVLGVVAATAAAFLPARTASGIAATAALAGRMPPPRSPGRLAWIGVGVFALGFVITPISWRLTLDGSGLALGLAALSGGLLLAIPFAVTVVGRAAARLPATLRLAARDVARHGRRTGAALAATALALSAAVLVSAAGRADAEYWRRTAFLTEQQALITSFENASRAPDELLPALNDALPGATVAGIAPVVHAAADSESAPVWAIRGDVPDDGQPIPSERIGQLTIGTTELVRALGVPQVLEALASDRVVALINDGAELGHITIRPDAGGPPSVVDSVDVTWTAPDTTLLPRFLVSPAGARSLGLRPGPVQQVLVHAHRPVTDDDVKRIRRTAAGLGADAHVFTANDWLPATIKLRRIVLGLSGLVSLLIVAATLAMVGAESRRDRAILSAVGAAPFARRRLAAARAFLLTIVAGIVAVPAGIAPFAGYQWARPDGYPVLVPWEGIAVVLLVVPILAAASAFVLSRRASTEAMLRPLA